MEHARVAADTWSLVLAGGDGTRLRELTALLAGAPIPKQYCRITGDRSMLEATLARIAPLGPPERTLVIVNRDHLTLASEQLRGLPPENVLVQPCNRDTGPGILWSLLALERRSPGARVAMFPSDHYVANDVAFRGCVHRAERVVEQLPDKLVLLGIEPDHPASGYGYVVPSGPLPPGDAGPAFHVETFREKPDRALARRILRRGALWNSLVMVFHAARVLELLAAIRPDAYRALADAGSDAEAIERHYASASSWNFSSDFLAHVAPEMVVLRAEDTGWSDWGTRQSIERTFAALKQLPPWHAPSARRGRASRRSVA
jgi:mannose-1-phosphate guanylyltransferase